jgi:mannitol-1-phosphate/altronate dehydrogenase
MMSDEVIPTLPTIDQCDYDNYSDEILARFSNSAIADTLERICSDGSQKLKNQLFPIIDDCIKLNLPYNSLAFSVAAWIVYLGGKTQNGDEYSIIDPIAYKLKTAANQSDNSIIPILSIPDLFPDYIRSNTWIVQEIEQWLQIIRHSGVMKALEILSTGDTLVN